ncbi:unnamed protein product, partial [Effrenium voratum]
LSDSWALTYGREGENATYAETASSFETKQVVGFLWPVALLKAHGKPIPKKLQVIQHQGAPVQGAVLVENVVGAIELASTSSKTAKRVVETGRDDSDQEGEADAGDADASLGRWSCQLFLQGRAGKVAAAESRELDKSETIILLAQQMKNALEDSRQIMGVTVSKASAMKDKVEARLSEDSTKLLSETIRREGTSCRAAVIWQNLKDCATTLAGITLGGNFTPRSPIAAALERNVAGSASILPAETPSDKVDDMCHEDAGQGDQVQAMTASANQLWSFIKAFRASNIIDKVAPDKSNLLEDMCRLQILARICVEPGLPAASECDSIEAAKSVLTKTKSSPFYCAVTVLPVGVFLCAQLRRFARLLSHAQVGP